ncbi:MAG: alpha/beta fold hydrolase [Pseudomonadota bacterium]|jgi:pimeloyl-ACP methyl ester carboxylesterase|nr:alpha/beta fold hydrolase [Pseudomonadota bacterium]
MTRPLQHIVYVHGLWMSGSEGLLLRHRLARALGAEVHAFSYSAVLHGMDEITARLADFLAALDPPRVHFVGHSLGGLVLYNFFERHASPPPGRVVFLATPCVASRAAEQAGHAPVIGALMGRAVAEELLTRRERRWRFDRPLGIIAGSLSFGVGQFIAGFDEPSDGTVAVSETRLPGASAHLVLPVSHAGMLVSARVARECAHFLAEGCFRES